ncbi:hypothetical protein IQ238_12570 [Pleurocapsales cyanobacterium LEGE 06147]|nr:hypothetical protein [Pleurocapsales cyanobacterium LEGE 06147]
MNSFCYAPISAKAVREALILEKGDKLSIYMGQSAETSDFGVDCFTAWWYENQPQNTELDEWVINLDGGAATRVTESNSLNPWSSCPRKLV